MGGWGVVEPPTKFSKKGEGLTGPQLLEVGCWERVGYFFQCREGGCNCHIKNILKSEIFNDKKGL